MFTKNEIDTSAVPRGTGCVECEKRDGWWFHLRRCAFCGHIGCCDNSPGQHATHHFRETGHKFIQSFEPGETWFWNFESQEMLEGPDLPAPKHHPVAQGVPGPRGRVPADWQRHLHP